jgi:PAS domain S-box-containing protein
MAKKEDHQFSDAGLRQRAEESLVMSSGKDAMGDSQRLIHELEVHKIELEMQNAELIKTREDLEILLEKYTDLYDFAPVGYFTLDLKGTIHSVNLTGSSLLGVERSRLIGQRFVHFVSEENSSAFAAFFAKTFSSLAKETCEVSLRKGANSRFYVQIEAIATTSGQQCRLALIDITARIDAEEALQDMEVAAEAAFQKVNDAAEVARQKVDEAATVAHQMLEEEAVVELHESAALPEGEESKKVTQMKRSTEVALRMVAAAAETARLKVDKASEAALQEEMIVAHRQGIELTGEAWHKLDKTKEKARQMVERAADVARQKVEETAEALLRALRRAQEAESQTKLAEDRLKLEELLYHSQKLESLGVLAGGIAHDFNNILTGILGNVTLAQLFLDETHKSFQPLVFAEKAALRAAELATQLLTFAKGGAPVKKCMSLRDSIQESVSLSLRGANVSCVVKLAADLHAVEADGGQLSQAFNNIIINAAQAMPGGGTLTLGAENVNLTAVNRLMLPGGAYVRITFADEGCGVAEEIQNRIFDPYYTTKPGGSGLGLASVHSIVRKHGGHIGVRSTIGSGTTFTIHLPSTGRAIAPVVSAEPSLDGGRAAKGNILVMDDEALIRNLAMQLLQHLGYAVTSCAKGEEAVTLYQAAMRSGTPFLAAIMDLTIPGGMGGNEAAKLILDLDPAARLIVSSGYSSDPVMADFVNYGFCAAMSKPYRVAELAKVMRSVNGHSECTKHVH